MMALPSRVPKMSETNDGDDGADAGRGRRRVLRKVAHDRLGQAKVEWAEVPDDRSHFFDRQPLSIEGEPPPPPKPRQTSDLRRLDAWIKARRAAEESKQPEPEAGFWARLRK